MAEQQEPLGQQVGAYHLLRQLGKGSFGTVYLAEHRLNHSQTAVKLLRFHLINPNDFKAFLNEARTIVLDHEHIVPLLDFGLTRDDTPYLIMEYAVGGTLRQRYPKGTKLPFVTLDSYVGQLASALQYAHDHNVIHRDVKPENVLLRADGTLLLSDFGIAKALEQSSFVSMQTQVGTPAYMAPEQSQGKPCPASDQYSLAVMVYEWLAGRLPFQGAALEVMLQHRVDKPLSLQEFNPEVPMQVEQVVMQALAKMPEERFCTVEQFAEALHAAFQIHSATNVMMPPSDELDSISPMVSVSQPLVQPFSSHAPWITHGLANPAVLSQVSSMGTIDLDIITGKYLGTPCTSKTPAMLSAEIQTSQSQLQSTRTGKTQVILDSLQVDLSSQPSLSVDRLPTIKHSRARSSEPFSAHVRTMIPRVRNKRFTRRRLMVPLVCLILLVSLVGGGGWIFVKQQQLLNFQHTTATVHDFQHATATASNFQHATATASNFQYTTATVHDLQHATATATVTAYNTAIASTVTNATETASSIAPQNAATPNPVLQTTTIDDSAMGTGPNQFNYVGTYWYHSGAGCPGPDCSNSYPSYNNTSSWDGQANDYVTLSFTGVQIKLYEVIDPMYGIGAVSIDGGTETNVDFYASTHEGNQLLWTSPTLPTGTHTFKLRVTGNHNPNARPDIGFPAFLDRVDILG